MWSSWLGQSHSPNLRHLDLSDNYLTRVSRHDLNKLQTLQVLVLDGNPLASEFFVDVESVTPFQTLRVLKMSRIRVKHFQTSLLEPFTKLEHLNLSDSNVDLLFGEGLGSLKELRVLDLTGCPLNRFPRDVIRSAQKLKRVFADNYKLCCPATLPVGFNAANCEAPSDEILSCDALLRSDVHRVVLAVFAALALVGNLGSFVYRVFVSKVRSRVGYGVFVTHLSVSDFVMGVYLAIIGVADRVYLGNYLWEDLTWKNSVACRVAGFLSLLSSEVSALLICLTTLDRLLVLRFPFSQIHFRKNFGSRCLRWSLVARHCSGRGASAPCDFPLAVLQSERNLRTSPHHQARLRVHDYAFSVMIVFNVLLFLCIAAGQIAIYWTVKQSRMASSSDRTSEDLVIAQRLIAVAVTDFLCWFPIGLLGLLASTGTAVPGVVNVAMAIFVLPLNSALNPFLYTLNVVLKRLSRDKEKRLLQMIKSACNT